MYAFQWWHALAVLILLCDCLPACMHALKHVCQSHGNAAAVKDDTIEKRLRAP